MNNFIKYPSASDVNVSEMFTKDNLVSIIGLRADESEIRELSILNKNNNFTNIDIPSINPDFFEISFNGIAIAFTNNPGTEIIINRTTSINLGYDPISKNKYDFTLITNEGGEIKFNPICEYYIYE